MYNNKWVLDSATERRKLYDRLYEIGEFLLKKYNPCGIKDGRCNGKRDIEFCCDYCKYQTPKGCRIKCLKCKLWLCSSISYSNKHLYKQLSILNELANLNYLNYLRMPRAYALRMTTNRQVKSLLHSRRLGGF